jgi:Domain of unknown function (DUF5668)/B-box zinc finger
MNCANHADASAVAYCRTCGKALCANCTRPVRGVIYCEDCLGAKMEGTMPPAAPGFVPGAFNAGTFARAASGTIPATPSPAGIGGGPNPTVAGILGAIPFGIGAVYNGQYAKGLAHLGIFALLIAGCNSSGDALPAISGIGIAFFVVYQIIDAVRSARAIQAGLPAPDPYGLSATFGGGAKIETSKIPMGAVVLILLGVLFLLHTMGFAEHGLDRFWPLILIAVGGWLFARNWGLLSSGCKGCQCAHCRTRRIMGPAILLTIGILFLLNVTLHGPGFGRTWPIILLVVGGVKLLQGSSSAEGHIPPLAPTSYPPGGPVPPTQPASPGAPVPPSSEVNRG